ncbi:hypothetical protein FRC04_005696 [Tulasnella sp. 424]|nr:hypothetical protein FRC04_005696 [Tulasnella sp. 424]KAG8962043.1 hypothetical protein FRC05_005630 [Tulasnella sp. 425]
MPKAESSRIKSKPKAPKSSTKPPNEIDDIFSTAKGKGKSSHKDLADGPPNATPTTRTPLHEGPITSKKEKNKKGKLLSSAAGEQNSTLGNPLAGGATEPKGPARKIARPPVASESTPDVVVDPSTKLEAKARALSRTSKDGVAANTQQLTEEDLRFVDSRGTGPRRQTEEGYLIYKEDELGITGKGGDTPLCPFDCECCY